MRTIYLFLTVAVTITACTQHTTTEPQSAKSTTYENPIFPGDHPDPSILVDGEDYYVVHSSFEYYPGLTIWHSRDLLNWEPVTNALTQYVGSVWAPDLVKYEDNYYIYFPASNTNYVITASSIEGPWSDPVELKVPMIDPGHVVDEAGNRYLFFSSGSYVPLTKDGLSIAGEVQTSYEGWPIPPDWSIECFCMEGPKLFKKGEYYYLTVAEGGTAGPATGHMVISARSKSLQGPWENSPHNPILRAQSNEEKWWSVGHGTVFKDTGSNWWMIFHGYEKDHYNMGRQTMLSPLEWTDDGWFKIPDDVNMDNPVVFPDHTITQSSSHIYVDPLDSEPLNPRWKFFGEPDDSRYAIGKEGVVINGKGTGVASSSPLLFIPTEHSYTAQVELEIKGDAVGGLILFYNPSAYSGILTDGQDILANLRGWQFPTEKRVVNQKAFLKLVNRNHTVDMYYSLDGKDWNKIENSFESSAYHHNILSGFMSLRIGLTAFGDGSVTFSNFNYSPID